MWRWDPPAANLSLSDALVLRLRAQAQRLTESTRRMSTPAAILRDICGLQAQLMSAARLGLRVRSAGLSAGSVTRALNQERSIVRTWLMRGTLHVVAAEDLGWLLSLLGPQFAAGSKTRHAQLGLDRDLKLRGVDTIRRILADAGPLTRYDLVDRLRRRGIRLDPKSQAPIHLIRLAALQGVLCFGPDQENGEPTYVLIDDWARQPSSSRASALGELARRYFAAYGPATVEDLASWSGLPLSQTRSAVALARPGLAEVTIRGQPGFLSKGRPPRSRPPARANPDVRLLPAFDTYLLGYRNRELMVPQTSLRRRLQRGGGWLHPAVIVDGRAIAAWRLAGAGRKPEVLLEPFEKLSGAVHAGIEAEAGDLGRFLALPLQIKIGEPAAWPAPRSSRCQ
ncbi:MAG: winged helix DNA-binding domain-containing protein [Chloroflexi bacterium]|nr:MAG: winged helix DNA-binding domain-containing protein [Chloroflexota bacterium]